MGAWGGARKATTCLNCPPEPLFDPVPYPRVVLWALVMGPFASRGVRSMDPDLVLGT